MMSTKRGSLFAPKPVEADTTTSPQVRSPAGQEADLSARLQADASASQQAVMRYPKASTRQGKKSITVYVEPETLKQLRRLREADEDEGKDATIQDLMIEAINALFAKRGVSRLA